MNPQDKVERVLKEMHLIFSRSLEYGDSPDQIIMDRAEFMKLLDRLTKGIYEMMEQYEQTRQARLAAERSFKRNAEEIIEQANANAEDVYAASVLYTADAIGKIRSLMDQTNDSMNELFMQFRRELRDQKDLLRAHESELQAQLADMTDTRKYLSILRDINREQERKNRDLEAEREIGNQYARNLFRAAVSPAEGKPAANAPAGQVSGAPTEGNTAHAPVSGDKPEVTVNKNASYFKWKEDREDNQEDSGESVPDAEKAQIGQEGAKSVIPTQPPKEDAAEKSAREDDIYRQVLEEERKQDEEEEDSGQIGAGDVLRTILFGRDPE